MLSMSTYVRRCSSRRGNSSAVKNRGVEANKKRMFNDLSNTDFYSSRSYQPKTAPNWYNNFRSLILDVN